MSAKVAQQVTPIKAVQDAPKDAQKDQPKDMQQVPAKAAERAISPATVEAAREYFKQFEFKYLLSLKSVLLEEIQIREKDALLQAKAEIRKIAESVGVSLEEILSLKSPKAVAKPSAPGGPRSVYRHPNNPALEWKSRGPQPHWLKDLLAAGKSLESMRVGV